MNNNYRHLYRQPDVPLVLTHAQYCDPVPSQDELQRAAAERLKQQAALRRAKLAERWIVYTVAGMLALAMLPVVLAVAVIAVVVAIARRIRRRLRQFHQGMLSGAGERTTSGATPTAPVMTDIGVNTAQRRRAKESRSKRCVDAARPFSRQHATEGV
jgi:hypothetical protein